MMLHQSKTHLKLFYSFCKLQGSKVDFHEHAMADIAVLSASQPSYSPYRSRQFHNADKRVGHRDSTRAHLETPGGLQYLSPEVYQLNHLIF